MFFSKNENLNGHKKDIESKVNECIAKLQDHAIDEKLISVFEGSSSIEEKMDSIIEYVLDISYEMNFFISNFPVAMFVIDPKRKMVAWNRGFEEITEFSSNDIRSLSIP